MSSERRGPEEMASDLAEVLEELKRLDLGPEAASSALP
jgi:hypothetical protein